MARELGRAPTPAEIAERIGATPEQVLEAREAAGAYRAVSLDRPRDEDDEEGDGSPTRSASRTPASRVAEDAATVERLMRVLTDREREVLRLRFEEDLTQSEIGERVGVSQMHVSRLIRQSIARLRDGGRGAVGSRRHGALGPADLDVEPHQPQILHSDARRGAHRSRIQPARRARSSRSTRSTSARYVVVIDGEVEIGAATARGGGPGCRRSSTRTSATRCARATDARLLLVLAPWPGDGHPGARDD